MPEDIKKIARRNREELWNSGDLNVADQIFAADCFYHINDPITPYFGEGPEAAKKWVNFFRSAFPDLHIIVEDILAEGGRAAVRWTARGTHQRELMGVAPTHMKITATGIDIYRVVDGKIQELWVNWDTMSFMQLLGLEPLTPSEA